MSRATKLAPLLLVTAVPILLLLTFVGGSGAERPTDPCTTISVPGGEQVGDTQLDAEQMQVATEAVRAVRAFEATADKPHAAVIVLATGFQESQLRNLDYGDRDSLGFLQQRPSQGWGTPDQVRDVTYATTTFLHHLIEVPGWETRRVTEVAADVQRPAEEYRGLYEQWVPLATDLAEQLWSTSGSAATVNTPPTDGTTSAVPGLVRLHHANLFVGKNQAQFREDLGAVVADRPDFVTLNEVYHRSPGDLQPDGYQAWHPAGPRDARDTAVLWRTDTWTLAGKGTVLMHNRNVKWGTRYVNWVTLTAASGSIVSVISGHASPGGPGREGLYAEFRTRLVSLTAELGTQGPVLFGGDLNIQYPHRQPAQAKAFEDSYAAAGARTTYGVLGEPAGGWATGGAHFNATIDYIITAGALPVRHATTGLRHSDHRMLSAEIQLGGDPAGAATPLGSISGNTHACDPTMLAASGGAVVYPVPAHLASSNQNNWGSHGAHWSAWHTGTDFSVACGTPVLAAHAGTIEIDTSQSWAGEWLVKVTTGPRHLTTWYVHMQTLRVTPGQIVQPGQQIGEVGALGNVSGCHLHFEVHLKNGPIYGPDNVDPTTWLAVNLGKPTGTER
ncbi:hypothetical protein DDE18_15755 [Nocardioides gansuensis]|uniref:Uncharacterized protein n=1 Tax=Nocardioides gansuensis TaxID=2138300 RepID=A0A2T8F8V4_9ACTN|nr:peptidoglycan DD-metalloendopeptidase family protein [Nocardioides gansuensis]PVG82129.1 hypothetical protein DDE18_15755 [Nocardioides gansuensis]